MNDETKELLKKCIAIIFFIIILCVVGFIVIRYQVVGEENMPFELSKMVIISTAEGNENKQNEENLKWNIDINQNNDIYLFIDKNEKKDNKAIIDSVSIDNIKVVSNPAIGDIKVYMPNSEDGRLFVNKSNFEVLKSLTYKGSKNNNEKNLEIGNQGGKIVIRFSNNNVASYKSNDDIEIVHDGTLLEKTGLSLDDIKFKVNFDLVIKVGKVTYKTNMDIELPYDDILSKGTTQIEKTDLSDIIFKRQ